MQPKHIRDTLIIFAEAMDKKLRRDDDTKPAWETDSMFLLIDWLHEEITELEEAFLTYQTTANDPDGKALMLECADVGLCAMMLFSLLHPLTRHNRRGHALHKIPRSVEPPNPNVLAYESWIEWQIKNDQALKTREEILQLNETTSAAVSNPLIAEKGGDK